MSDNSEKAQRELRVFNEFVDCSDLVVVPKSIENRGPPEPDILCEVRDEGHVAFELKELCDPSIAQICSDLVRENSEESKYVRSANPVGNMSKKARTKQYESDFPVELLFYTDGRIICPPDTVIPTIRRAFDNNRHQFRRVWFMGQPDETCECVFQASDVLGEPQASR